MESNRVLSPAQKGFMPHDGVLEHNFTLRRMFDDARTGKGEFIATFIDFSNAFGSVPHSAIFTALDKSGADGKFTNLIKDIYTHNSTRIATSSRPTGTIDIECGIRQGCPLSGLLFNLAIDPIIKKIQGQEATHKILAYADDLVLLSSEPEEMQDNISKVKSLAEKINIRINTSKTYSLHMSGKTPIGARATKFYINDEEISSLQEGDFTKFLGKPVGFHITSNLKELAKLMETAQKILQSKLAPWQRIDALKSFFYPSISFLMRTAQFQKGEWKKLDDYIRAGVKTTLNVPREASNDYLYGPTRRGCIGIPVAAQDSDYYLIDAAFKLLSSNDIQTTELALEDLQTTVQKRLGRPTDLEDAAAYLTGNNEDEFRRNTNAISNVWTNARKASNRNNVEWSFENSQPAIRIQEKTVYSKERRKVLSALRENLRSQHLERLCALPSQGKAMDCVSADPASSHFNKDGLFTRFADWRFIHRARLNLLPLNGNRHAEDNSNRSCRRCGYEMETLPHVINHCMTYAAVMTRRHNAIVSRVRKAASKRYTVLSENEAVNGNLRPDLVLVKNNNAIIIDVTVPFENRMDAFCEAREGKKQKYENLAQALRTKYAEVKVDAIVVGSLGAWDPDNDILMKKLCSRSYLKLFKKLCVSDTIKYSRDIYVEHVTGVRQL